MEKKQRKQKEYGDITLEKRVVIDKNGKGVYYVVEQKR